MNNKYDNEFAKFAYTYNMMFTKLLAKKYQTNNINIDKLCDLLFILFTNIITICDEGMSVTLSTH